MDALTELDREKIRLFQCRDRRDAIAIRIFVRMCADFPEWSKDALRSKAACATEAADAIICEIAVLNPLPKHPSI